MIEIHPATLEDIPWIKTLVVDSTVYGVPEGRDTPNESVKKSAADSVKELELVLDVPNDMAIYVAFDGPIRVGYLILQFNQIEPSTGDQQTYLLDMAVEKTYWGSNVNALLVRHAARVTAERGYRYMTAMISASNRRALLKAQRLGFAIERHSLVMACGPEGAVALPGRPEQERSHQLSRRKKKA